MTQRRKTGRALSDKHITICDTCRQKFHLGSRNDFIEEAINYYHNKVLYELNQLAEKRRAEEKLERYDKAHPRSAPEGGDGACV